MDLARLEAQAAALRRKLERREKKKQEAGAPKDRFVIADSERDYCDITRWVQDNCDDVAFEVSHQ